MVVSDPAFTGLAVALFAAVAALTWGAPSVALVGVCALLPFRLLGVAGLDHSLLGLPAHAGPDVIQVLDRTFLVDAATVAGLLAGAGLRLARRERRPGRPPPLVGFALVYTAVVAGLMLASGVSAASADSATVTAAGPVALLVVWSLRLPPRAAAAVVAGSLAAAAGVAVAAIVEQRVGTAAPVWLRGGPPPAPASSYFTNGASGYRSGSVLASTLELGFYLGAALPAVVAVIVAGGRRHRLAALVGAPLIAAGLVLSFTRSGWIGAAVGCVLVGLLAPRRRAVRLAVLGGVLAAATLVAVSAATHGLGDRVLRAGSNQGHLDHLRADLRLLADRPLGHGLGVIDAIGQNLDRGAIPDQASEDEYLAKGVEGGYLELVLYTGGTALMLGSLGHAWRRARRDGDPGRACLTAGALAAAAAVAVASLFLGIESPTFSVPLWAAAGLALDARRRKLAESPGGAGGGAVDRTAAGAAPRLPALDPRRPPPARI